MKPDSDRPCSESPLRPAAGALLGVFRQDVIGSTLVRFVSQEWDVTIRVVRKADGSIDSAYVERVADSPDPRRAGMLERMAKVMSSGQASQNRKASEVDESARAEFKRWRQSLKKKKIEQFLHVQRTLKQHGPVSLAVLNVRSAACFGRTVGADGMPGTGEAVGKACPRMVNRKGKPRCGACGCPTTSVSDLREVIRSPGWGCGAEKENKFVAMIPMPAEKEASHV